MPRYVIKNEQEFSYTSLFSSSSNRIEQQNTNIEISKARQTAIASLEAYKEEIKKLQEKKAKIEALLKKGGLSPNVQDAASKRLEELKIDLVAHQCKFNNLIESNAGLRSYFTSHAR